MEPFSREGQKGKENVARYARYSGIALLCLAVGGWTALHRRPRVRDDYVAAARAWVEARASGPFETCVRPALRGEPTPGNGTEMLEAAIQQQPEEGCATRPIDTVHGTPAPIWDGEATRADCGFGQLFRTAISHAEVCSPGPAMADALETIPLEARSLAARGEAVEALRLLFDALRVVDDVRRGDVHPPTAGRFFDVADEIFSAIEAILNHAERPDAAELDALAQEVEILSTTSPDSSGLLRGDIFHTLQDPALQGENPRSTPRFHSPREAVVGLHRIGEMLYEDCVDEASCAAAIETLRALHRPEEPADWKVLLYGRRAEATFRIWRAAHLTPNILQDIREAVAVHRTRLRLLAVQLERWGTSIACPSADELSAQLVDETFSHSIGFVPQARRDGVTIELRGVWRQPGSSRRTAMANIRLARIPCAHPQR